MYNKLQYGLVCRGLNKRAFDYWPQLGVGAATGLGGYGLSRLFGMGRGGSALVGLLSALGGGYATNRLKGSFGPTKQPSSAQQNNAGKNPTKQPSSAQQNNAGKNPTKQPSSADTSSQKTLVDLAMQQPNAFINLALNNATKSLPFFNGSPSLGPESPNEYSNVYANVSNVGGGHNPVNRNAEKQLQDILTGPAAERQNTIKNYKSQYYRQLQNVLGPRGLALLQTPATRSSRINDYIQELRGDYSNLGPRIIDKLEGSPAAVKNRIQQYKANLTPADLQNLGPRTRQRISTPESKAFRPKKPFQDKVNFQDVAGPRAKQIQHDKELAKAQKERDDRLYEASRGLTTEQLNSLGPVAKARVLMLRSSRGAR